MPDETPTPLPVVPCGIFFAGQRVHATSVSIGAVGDIPALVVSDALWNDWALALAVTLRLQQDDYDTHLGVVGDVLAALGVELQARANFNHETTP